MDLSSSQFEISGSESGWTMYLDHSQSYSYYPSANECHRQAEEDLSMVSDASSGPPHYYEQDDDCVDQNGCYFSASSASESTAKKGGKKKKKKGEEQARGRQKQQHSSYLEDTATSPAKCFAKKKTSISNGKEASMQHLSSTHLKGSASFQRHYSFLRSPGSETPASDHNPGIFQGKWE